MKRSDVRYACARAKNNNITSDLQPILDQVQVLLAPHQRWSNFKTTWDLLINKNNQIVIINPETDYDYVHSTCLEVSFLVKKGFSLNELNERKLNIVTIVEASMLDTLMTWENYSTAWGIEIDQEMKAIRTKMYNVTSSQISVTEEMIEASKKVPEVNVTTNNEVTPVELKSTPMSDAQIAAFKNAIKATKKDST